MTLKEAAAIGKEHEMPKTKKTAKTIKHSPATCPTHPLSIGCTLAAMYR